MKNPENPMQAVLFVAIFLIIQQIEGNLIYPHVVGNSVGLSGMWVLAAIAIGGKLFGVVGMFMMIPIVSVFYTLLQEKTRGRLAQKNIDPEKLKAQPPELRSRMKENRKTRKAKRAAQKQETEKTSQDE
jgi:predicted PurR-regulated permease PerM